MSTELHTLDLRALNAMDRAAFTAALGETFEHSPWVAEAAWAARPFDSVQALHDAMMAVVLDCGRSRQIEFLRGHPELSAGAVRAGALTADSMDEQKGAGLGALSGSEEESLARLNKAYRARHGFPFIACARHYTKAGILAELASRTAREPGQDLAEALRQIGFITRARLERRLAA
ncbi:2-oxo-4-hydroxy-4-carboxy-5-ureidoimidazoline decarboxylase [Variovorax sp. JS1663]|uniref:2-oxo-4-hydroxy-4-carboxy-5-ureidoimidazoline decarboxylase n=1 Tax=Variovorax sp. JS1663 TaxID=1851577 RepID=UPI000B3419B0|nr:2-oxo-4-hydroxy-4-carboxy-5-ureidoimidazoline decarboxylase [Variovorax sp. JS1663]OUL98385.1 OHCU decarboxylase [Variovorax sp. JS1663]